MAQLITSNQYSRDQNSPTARDTIAATIRTISVVSSKDFKNISSQDVLSGSQNSFLPYNSLLRCKSLRQEWQRKLVERLLEAMLNWLNCEQAVWQSNLQYYEYLSDPVNPAVKSVSRDFVKLFRPPSFSKAISLSCSCIYDIFRTVNNKSESFQSSVWLTERSILTISEVPH